MNTQNFNQSGGFPIKTQTLDAMQNAYSLFNTLGNLAGNFSIISGCEVAGALVSAGTVFINGEVLEFRGGQLGTSVVIVEEITQKEFKDGTNKNVLFVRYATFGLGATSFPWVNFKRPKTTLQLTEQKAEQTLIDTLITRITNLEARPTANVPLGMIAIWDRPANVIPTGWIEYQALRGRMPIGLDPNDPELDGLGTYDGAKNKILSIEEMPEHTHGGVPTRVSGEPDAGALQCNFDLNNTGNTLPQGSGQEFSIMNPYRVVHFIKYIG